MSRRPPLPGRSQIAAFSTGMRMPLQFRLMTESTLAAVWGRVLDLGKPGLDADAARAVLRMRFKRRDVARINELSALANEGRLGEQERAELDGYLAIGSVLTILHSKARMALKGEASKPSKGPRRKAS